nr:alpha-galactosidase [Agromyces atrinae]
MTTLDELLRDEKNGDSTTYVSLNAAGVACVLAVSSDTGARIVHWGADTGARTPAELQQLDLSVAPPLATNGVDERVIASILPEGRTGWTGAPGIAGHRLDGGAWTPYLVPTALRVDERADGTTVIVDAADLENGLAVRLDVEMDAAGVMRLRAELTNTGETPYALDALELALPVPTLADDILDFAGRWANERTPQRQDFVVGSHVREGRHGRTGADAATVLSVGARDFSFDSGEIWSMHVGFSGNHRVAAERTFDGTRLLRGGELLLPGEIVLAAGESYESPWVYAVHGVGLDAVAARFHTHLRARAAHPTSARPVVMNVWEAVYFNHDLDEITQLADLAAEAGVERFVLDDGWFGARRDDTAGLGDWVIADDVWGDGRFGRLVDHVNGLGMEFGLWFEPEMVNLDSDLARAHPEWLLQAPGRIPVPARNQQVLDLTHPGAYAHVRDQISALVRGYGIGFIKWDHNRDLVDAGSTRTGRAGVHAQTLAVYRLLAELRETFPALEIESCSSGGARVDLGILQHTDRVWASDCIDAHERQQIQRWTAQLIPLELIGSHVGEERAHTTGRRLDLSFRAASAVFGHFGIEWDLRTASADELAELREWVAFYKNMRPLLHTGTLVRRDLEDGALWMQGVVSPELDRAIFAISLRDRPATWPAGSVRLPGLDATRTYRVSAAGPGALRTVDPRIVPAWWTEGLVLSGASLAAAGVQIPALQPDHTALLLVDEVRA